MGDEERVRGEERELAAADLTALTARWLSVEEVMGPRPGWGADARTRGAHPALELVSAGEYQPVPAQAAEAHQDAAPDLVAADTALASRWFAKDPAPGKLAGRTVVLPFVVLAELATWPERLLWGHARGEDLSLWTDSGRVIAGDDTVARIWARITVGAQRAGSPPLGSDAWIAAGCLSYGLPLATANAKRYQYFVDRYGLKLV